MVTFQVNDMTCGHCVGTITKAVKAVDGNARVNVDLSKHVVEIDSAGVGAQPFREAISAAGYTALAVAGAAPSSGPSAQRGGGCCG
jgi:copper chaperone